MNQTATDLLNRMVGQPVKDSDLQDLKRYYSDVLVRNEDEIEDQQVHPDRITIYVVEGAIKYWKEN